MNRTSAARHRTLIVAAALAFLPALSPSAAQTAALTPDVTIEVAEVATLSMTPQGDRLLVTSRDTESALIYDTTRTSPRLLREIALDGTPVAAAWVRQDDRDIALVAVESEGDPLLQVLAQDLTNPRTGWVSYATFDLPLLPDVIAVSPDGRWAAAYGAQGALLFEIVAGGEINSLQVSDSSVTAAALTDGVLWVSNGRENSAAAYASGPAIRSIVPVTTDEPVQALAAASSTLAVALTAPAALLVMAEDDLSVLSSTPIRGTADSLTALPFSDMQVVGLYVTGGRSVTLVTLVRERVGQSTTVMLPNPIELLASGGVWLAASDGEDVELYDFST